MNANNSREKRVVIGVSGASGAALARIVILAFASVASVHVIVTAGARQTADAEGVDLADALNAATAVYAPDDFTAPPASGSWRHDGMVVCPCSMASLAAIASGAGTNLLHRAADVTLKENLPLALSPRETPLNLAHLRNMVAARELGAIIMPFMPAFYTPGETMAQASRQFAGRLMDQLGFAHGLCHRWGEDCHPARV